MLNLLTENFEMNYSLLKSSKRI